MGKQKHRAHGEGSVFQRNDGRWIAAISVKNQHGEPNKIQRSAKTKTAAFAALKELRQQVDGGVDMTAGNPEAREYIRRWLTIVEPTVRVKTFEGYESIMRVRVIPHIGNLKLSSVTPLVLQELYANLLASGLSSRSVISTHRTLHRAFNQAVRWGYIPRNPCDGVDPPRAERSEMQVLSQSQVTTLIESTREHRYHALYVLAVTTGMRLGELLGLKWSDLDLNTRRLAVRRAVQRQRQAGVVFTELKTKRARRTIELSQVAVDALKQHRANQVEHRLRVGAAWQDHDLVFANSWGNPLDPTWQSKPFMEVLDEVRLPRIRFHDLRHTAATLLLSQDVHPKVVSEMLGHATITLTLDTYSHLVPTLHSQAANLMDTMLGT